MKIELNAVFQKVPEGYIAFVEELPGANAQGDTLDEARSNLREAVQLVLEANRAPFKTLSETYGSIGSTCSSAPLQRRRPLINLQYACEEPLCERSAGQVRSDLTR